jgi:hypothetical protein
MDWALNIMEARKFQRLGPSREQEHLLGPMIDLYFDPKWEFNGFIWINKC